MLAAKLENNWEHIRYQLMKHHQIFTCMDVHHAMYVHHQG